MISMNQDTGNNGVLLASYVENITTRKDKTVKVTLGTQELSPEKAGELFSMMNKLVLVYLSEKGIGREQIEMVDKIDPDFGGKTQSQRLRDVLFRLWEVKPEGFKTFQNYYHHKTDEIINHYKSKID